MLAVVLIISILATIGFGTFQQARNAAWKQKARDSARQIATAVNLYLMDHRAFPSNTTGSATFQTTKENMAFLNSSVVDTKVRIYLDQDTAQRLNGMNDRWGNPFNVQMDVNFTGSVPNPLAGCPNQPDTLNANVVVWSWGPKQKAWDAGASQDLRQNSWCVAWQ